MHEVITNNLDLWTSVLRSKSTAGRGSNGKLEAYGIKKLRELILELAVKGKLVPQDPNDEPATALLAKIVEEKRQLIESGQIRERNSPAPIPQDRCSFEVSSSWKWVRLSEITRRIHYGYTASAKPEMQSVRLLRITDIQDNTVDWPSVPGCEIMEADLPQYQLVSGDILVARTGGTVGKTYLVTEIPVIAVFASYLIRIQGASALFVQYLKLFLESPTYWKQLVEGARGGAQPNVNGQTLGNMVVPLPPKSEQRRIVAKVDELLALCDQLEQQQTHSIEAHETLVETLLGTLTRVASQQELRDAWTRIANHFDTLFTTEHSIDQLKQTILQLALMGKLVPQDPNDEQASLLLDRIAKKKERMVQEGTIKTEKPLPEIGADERPFAQPEGWKWVRLGKVVHIRGGKRVSNGYQLLSSQTPHIYIRVSDMKDGSIDDSDMRYIDETMYSKISQYIITKDDIYMTIVGATIGKCGIVPTKFDGMNLTENAARLTPFLVSKYYLYKVLSAAFCQEQFIDKTKQVGVQKMALNRLASTIFPLPPLSEQNRIVGKVDELMVLCDALKARLAEAQITQIHLADAIVEQAVV